MDVSKMPHDRPSEAPVSQCNSSSEDLITSSSSGNVIQEEREKQKSLQDEVYAIDGLDTAAQSTEVCAEKALLDRMLNHLAESQNAPFKSQQVGDPDLNFWQKKEIAQDVLTHSPVQFLAKFGPYLLESHLEYFSLIGSKSQCYEIEFHLKLLRRLHCRSKRKVDIKNRRFEALKKLVEGGVYFSEEEMKKRNPLLYEQLIGQYLTPEEKANKKGKRHQSRSYVVHLMGQIEDHYVNCLKKQQEDDEEAEEMDTSDEEDPVEDDDDTNIEVVREEIENETDSSVVEYDTDDDDDNDQKQGRNQCQSVLNVSPRKRNLTSEEKDLLREEFASNMYRSFLEGHDDEFDYSQVDSNPEFECLAVRTQDEEEKYFDSETPELHGSGKVSEDDNDEEEDELDKFMKNLETDVPHAV